MAERLAAKGSSSGSGCMAPFSGSRSTRQRFGREFRTEGVKQVVEDTGHRSLTHVATGPADQAILQTRRQGAASGQMDQSIEQVRLNVEEAPADQHDGGVE